MRGQLVRWPRLGVVASGRRAGLCSIPAQQRAQRAEVDVEVVTQRHLVELPAWTRMKIDVIVWLLQRHGKAEAMATRSGYQVVPIGWVESPC